MVFYDEGNAYVDERIQYLPQGAETFHHLQIPEQVVQQGGFVRIFVASESEATVWFDELDIVHSESPIEQENHYDPWGLNLVGIETAGSPNHKYQYLGQEKQEELGLNWLDFNARQYDVQLGRFHAIDPLADAMTSVNPFQYAFNNSVNLIDPSGMAPVNPSWKEFQDNHFQTLGQKWEKENLGDKNEASKQKGKGNIVVLNSTDDQEAAASMDVDNENWDFLKTKNGDMESMALLLKVYTQVFGQIDNIVILNHGNRNLLAAFSSSPNSLTNGMINRYKAGAEKDERAVNYLGGLEKIAPMMKTRGKFIFTACFAGWASEGQQSFAYNMGTLLLEKNKGLNVFFSIGTNYKPPGKMGLRFDDRMETYGNNRGWQVVNKQTLKLGFPIHFNGSIQLNKKGTPVKLNYFE